MSEVTRILNSIEQGDSRALPQFGHFTRLPANFGFAFNSAPQLQTTLIDTGFLVELHISHESVGLLADFGILGDS